MEAAANIRSVVPGRRHSLVEAVAKLQFEFSSMKTELRHAHSENTRLKGDLSRWRSRCRAMPESDIASLRRRVAFYCHPDRGGDDDLMSRMNTLFDFLAFMA